MKTLVEHMAERFPDNSINEERVDEILLTLVAGSVLAYCCQPLMQTEAVKSLFGGLGNMFSGIGSLFGLGKKKDDKDKKDKEKEKEKSETEKLKDEVEQAKLRKELSKLNEDPILERTRKELDKIEADVKKGEDDVKKLENKIEEDLDELEELKKSNDPKDKEKADKLLQSIKKNQKDLERRNKALDDLKQKQKDTEDKISKLESGEGDNAKNDQNQIDMKQPKNQNRFMQAALGYGMALSGNEKDPEKRKQLEDKFKMLSGLTMSDTGEALGFEGMRDRCKEIYDVDFEDLSNDTLNIKPMSEEEIRKNSKLLNDNMSKMSDDKLIEMADKQTEESKTNSKDAKEQKDKIDELQEKLNNAESDEEKEKIKKELEEESKKSFGGKLLLAAATKKESDDSKDEPEKDADGNIVKKEEVKDPKTGEKKTVTTHTGPRGGKFYYPDGKPKTPENKVYVKESLTERMKRVFI